MQEYREWIQLLFLLISTALLIGVWKGKREATESATTAAIAATEKLFDVQLKAVNAQVSGMATTQAEEFRRLHAKANETQTLMNTALADLQDRYVPRPEYDAQVRHCAAVERRLDAHLTGVKGATE